MDTNPFEPGLTVTPGASGEQPPQSMSGREAYNLVSDTIVGVNFRKSDNLFQAKFVFGSVVLLAVLGAILAAIYGGIQLPWYGGAGIGALAGLILGVIASGIVLMIYRGLRHLKGKHNE